MTPLLDIDRLGVTIGSTEVVKHLSLRIHAGERVALVGESGSGKTVTALSLLGLVPQARTRGHAWLGGRDLLALSEAELQSVRGSDVAMVFQEPMTALNPLMTVGRQIAEIFRQKMALTEFQSMESAIEMLAKAGLNDPAQKARSYPHQLSGGQRQRVVIAMALACQPRLLIADEPTTALDVTLRAQMLDLLTQLQAETGMAVLLITHDLPLVRRFADRVTVMKQGEHVEEGPVDRVFTQPAHAYTRALIDSRPERDLQTPTWDRAVPGPLEARNLRVAYPVPQPGLMGWFQRAEVLALRQASFHLRRGQTLAVVGESGSGKSTLALAVLNLIPYAGDIRVLGKPWAKAAITNRLQRRTVQVVFQDPYSSLSPRMTVEELVGEGLRVHEPKLDARQRQTRVLQALAEVGLVTPQTSGAAANEAGQVADAIQWLARYPHEFSGGQRQRLAIARALVVQPDVLVLDEPTSALDVTVQKQVLQLLQRLQRERGLSFLLITHDMDVVRAMAHEVMVLRAGEVVEQGPAEQVLENPDHPYTQALMSAAGHCTT